MYQFSRAIYRELAPHILARPARRSRRPPTTQPCCTPARPWSSAWPPTATTSPVPHARCSATSAATFRCRAQAHVHRVVNRYVGYAQRFLARAPARGHARRQRRRRRGAAPPHARARPASACRCRTTATAPPTSTSPTPRTASSRRLDAPEAPSARRVGWRMLWASTSAGRSPTRCSWARRSRCTRRRCPTTPSRRGARACSTPSRAVLDAAGAEAAGGGALRARHDGRDQRAAGGAHRAHRAGRDGRLHRRDRARPPGAPAPVQAVRRGAGAAGAGGAALRAPERMAARRPGCALEPGRAGELVGEVAVAEPEAVAVALLHSYADPQHERLLGALLAEALPPGDARVALLRARGHVSRVRAHRDDRRSTRRCRRCWAAYLRRLSAEASARRAARAARSCSPPAASPRPRAPPRTPR